MNKNIKKITSAILASSVLLSFTGCAGKPYKQVYYAADDLAKAIIDMDANKIEKLCNDIDDDDLEELQLLCDLDSISDDDNKEFIEAIKNTISYNIDAGSISTSGNKGSVKVIFTLSDWESVADNEDNMEDVSSATKALKGADSITISVTLKFVKSGDKWLATNAMDITSDLYDFSDESFFSEYDDSLLSYAQWWFTEEGLTRVTSDSNPVVHYTDTSMLDFDLYLIDNSYDSEVYYVVKKDGDVVYTSMTGHTYGYYDSLHGAILDGDGYIPAGTYTISFYIGDSCIITGTAEVS